MTLRSRTLSFALVFCFTLVSTLQVLAEPMVVNGDFEADTEAFTVWPGYTGNGNPDDLSGWTGDAGRGINPVSGDHESPAPFRDNGGNDTHVAFLQGEAYIEQTVGGFEVGQDYVLGIDFNSRNCCGDLPIASIFLNDQLAGSSVDLFPDPGAVPPVGGTEPWYHADIEFTADVTDITVRVQAAPAAGGDATMLVDNVTFSVVPEPCSSTLLFLGLLGFVAHRRRQA